MNTINFYKLKDPYGCFSNFSRHPIVLDGRIWPTTEHYFQAMKFHDPVLQEAIRVAPTPRNAADMGRDRSKPLREDWEAVKDSFMMRAVKTKFEQHPDLLKILLETGDLPIAEHTEKDSYWGDGGDGSGKNVLGKILMTLRNHFRKTSET